MNPNIIDIKNLSFSYEKSAVLEDLSFSVDKSSFFVIIGPNGSGKSTLLKIISGILSPQSGTVDILGVPIYRYTRKKLARTISLVPQLTSVDFPFSVLEVVLMGRSPHLGILGLEQEKDIRIARQALRFTGIEHLSDREMSRLSGGEQQRVFISRAICQDPRHYSAG